jgi:Ca2+-binding EF-hand superfamily protein
MLVVLTFSVWTATAAEPAVPESVTKEFNKADGNRDGRLSQDEFVLDRGPVEIARRDFLLFDLNSDKALSVEEFWAVPPATAAEVRGPLPDPMQTLVGQVMTALDKSLANWHENPKVEVDAHALATALTQRFQKYGVQPADRELDPDGNGKVSRDEARRFLEIQFGIRRHDGKLLRLPTGRVVNYMLYLFVDQDKNDVLDKTEFIDRSYGDPKTVADEFEKVDVDKSGKLSFDEWCLVPWRGVNDPVMEFRQKDTNLDAFLDPKELLAGPPDWKQPILINVFPAFDLNLDGKLSLAEYRLTMPANLVLQWQSPLSDSNGDGVLSFGEFRFDPMLFPLLRATYFLRLDQNESGSLDPEEFSYKRKVHDEFFVMNADGTGWKSLFKYEGHSACGSPTVSPDGKFLAFDSWANQQQGASAIYVMTLDGGEPEEVISGMMPSWSQDGKKLACSRSSPLFGSWLIDVSGEDNQHIGTGWGAQFSPDGTKFAFTEGTALKVYDFGSEMTDIILNGAEFGYQQIFWNVAWSPDGKRICFKAVKADGTQLVATVNTDGNKPDLKVHYEGKVAVNADFAWHPTENRVIYAMFCAERGFTQLYEFDPNKDAAPTLVKGQDVGRNNTDACWTPDGNRLIVISGDY